MGLAIRWDECETPEPIQEQLPQQPPRRRASRPLRRLRLAGAVVICGMIGISAGVAASGIRSTFHNAVTLRLQPATGITFALASSSVDRTAGFVSVTGNFENRRNTPVKQIEAVVELLDKEGNTVGLESALVALETVPAQGNSPFHVVVPDKPQVASCRIAFRELLGATLN